MAQFNLAIFYEKGQGVPQDYEQAIAWLHKSGDNGNKDAVSRVLQVEIEQAKSLGRKKK